MKKFIEKRRQRIDEELEFLQRLKNIITPSYGDDHWDNRPNELKKIKRWIVMLQHQLQHAHEDESTCDYLKSQERWLNFLVQAVHKS